MPVTTLVDPGIEGEREIGPLHSFFNVDTAWRWDDVNERIILDRYLLTAIGFTPGGRVKVQYIYSQVHIHNKKKNTEE